MLDKIDRYYAIFAIGPVQSFISASRKLEDLWGGSYLLSYLIRQSLASIRHICNERQMTYQIIYPHYSPDESDQPDGRSLAVANYPNRITFMLEASEESADQLMRQLETKVRNELVRISDWAVQEVFDDHTAEGQRRVERLKVQAAEQVERFLEVNWIAHRCDLEGDLNRQETEQLFHELKGQRSMHYVPEQGIACTVYQRMDALCYETPVSTDRYGDMKKKLQATWGKRNVKYKPRDLENKDKARIRDNEFLCAISLVRRVARDFFRQEFDCDPHLFAKYESVVNIGTDEDGYYAVLLMDGDNMGQFFNGLEDEVRNTSQQLSRFASQSVPAIVQEHRGVLLYAGGDDVLALFPVEEVLSAAYSLRVAFGEAESGLKGATASTGIAIGHKRTPLQQMLNEARELEKAAKSYTSSKFGDPVKNAFALSVLPRSGEYLGPAVLPWETEGIMLTKELTHVVELLSHVISTSFIYEFASTFQALVGSKTDIEPEYLEEMVLLECFRLIDRSVYDKSLRQELRQNLIHVPLLHRQLRLKGFIDLLKIMAFFNRKEKSSATIDINAG